MINFAVVFGLHGFFIYIYLLVKVARPIVCVGTPSIFESLILKEIDLYCKNFITHVIHIDLTLLLFYFFRDRNKYHVTIVLALNRVSALIGIFFANTLRYVYFGCLSSIEVSLNFYKKGINYA